MTAGYGNDNDNDGDSHEEDVDSTNFTTKNFNCFKKRAEGRGMRAKG